MKKPQSDQKIWFRAKRYGFGWTPSTWQGWVITGGYVVWTTLLTVGLLTMEPVINPGVTVAYLALVALGITTLIVVSIRHGEKLKWRWGHD